MNQPPGILQGKVVEFHIIRIIHTLALTDALTELIGDIKPFLQHCRYLIWYKFREFECCFVVKLSATVGNSLIS